MINVPFVMYLYSTYESCDSLKSYIGKLYTYIAITLLCTFLLAKIAF